MGDSFQSKIADFLQTGHAATFQEIAHGTGIPQDGLSLALGIMLRGGLVLREAEGLPTRYRLRTAVPAEKPRGAA